MPHRTMRIGKREQNIVEWFRKWRRFNENRIHVRGIRTEKSFFKENLALISEYAVACRQTADVEFNVENERRNDFKWLNIIGGSHVILNFLLWPTLIFEKAFRRKLIRRPRPKSNKPHRQIKMQFSSSIEQTRVLHDRTPGITLGDKVKMKCTERCGTIFSQQIENDMNQKRYFPGGQNSATRWKKKTFIFYFRCERQTPPYSSIQFSFLFYMLSVHCSVFCCLFRLVVRFVDTCKYYTSVLLVPRTSILHPTQHRWIHDILGCNVTGCWWHVTSC